ncbi:hypothetical protein TrRE_jg9652 [Triparma retinervis]|uniref:Uncharacterized protein n=1 Tax=Triparma retinervis TaxID=2557542 RepID=A0A9W7G5L5_9STRA|nr:hypothetical protein TrRE_jg9652 [Triparma retinervis]
MSENKKKLQSVHSTLEEDVPFSEQDNESELANLALAGLLEPSDEIVNALADCKARLGGIRLNMGSMNLAFVPFEVKALTDLRILNLRDNKLTMFPSDVCAALNELEELNLAQNELAYLPENISAMSNLKKLQLSRNQLKELPMGLFGLPALQEIRLDNNLLTNLQGQIADCHVLRTVVLSNNFLKIIPHRMAELKFLVKVDLSGNPIDQCPPNVMLLHQKNELLLHKNKRKGLIKRSHVLKKTMDDNLERILLEEQKGIDAMNEGGNVDMA